MSERATTEVDQHIAWLRQYVAAMTAGNWRDMQTRLDCQIDKLTAALAVSSERAIEAASDVEFIVEELLELFNDAEAAGEAHIQLNSSVGSRFHGRVKNAAAALAAAQRVAGEDANEALSPGKGASPFYKTLNEEAAEGEHCDLDYRPDPAASEPQPFNAVEQFNKVYRP